MTVKNQIKNLVKLSSLKKRELAELLGMHEVTFHSISDKKLNRILFNMLLEKANQMSKEEFVNFLKNMGLDD